MSTTVSLDSIREAAEAKYGSTVIAFGDGQSVELTNVLRLPKERRKALTSLQEKLDADDADQAELLADALRTVASDKKSCDALLKLVGDDLAVLAEVFASYTKGTQAGEA